MSGFITFLLTSTPMWYLVQPLWRDEAFSVLFAAKPIADIVTKSSVEPPFYYVLLKVWILLFGTGEIAVRLLSTLGVLLASYVVILWAEREFKSHWLSWVTPLLFFFNPMILYYAFEVRAYGWYILFAVLAMSAYLKKDWRLFILSSIFGFYTHLFMVFVIGVSAIHYALTNIHTHKKVSPKKIIWDPMVRSLILIGIASIPWIIRIFYMMPKFKDSWYFPVDFQLVKSVLGNMFLGYDGTPWYFWKYTAYLSIALLGIFFLAWNNKTTRHQTGYFLLMIFVPLCMILSISIGIKPLFVNRYLIPVTIAQILLIPYALLSLKPQSLRVPSVLFLGIGIVLFSLWFPKQHKKADYRTPMKEISFLMKKDDFIYVDDPIIYPEALYYASNPNRLFLYAPTGTKFPWYIGDAIFAPQKAIAAIPLYPQKAYVLSKDGTYSVLYAIDTNTMPSSQ